ncbi:DNA recombination protein RmuC [Ereboglobus luteus]|uniref:DNA recombination protein RmuC n=1 Tax=Ereboglobus luteus TaxID=1796921 RepID=A0A2U8E7A9_9BACT|nr:DNA recombination protein RmuC [Ereboglobus luteus]
MVIAYLILAAILGVIAGALLAWLHARGQRAALVERLRARDAELARLAEVEAQRIALEKTLAGERAAAAEKIAAFNDAHARLTAEFKALSSDALKSNSDAFVQFAQQALKQYQQKAEGDLAARQQAIDSLVKPLKESLEKVDTKIGELEQKRANAYGQLGQQLESLNTAQTRLQAETLKLSNAFRSTSYAGSWGELQLRRVVELADMLSYCDFTEQETATGGDGEKLRADLVVRLPGGQRIVVDAKTPVQAYRDALDAADENARASKLAEHAQKMRTHIDQLGAKNYWQQFQPAPEFVVLFVPGDHFLTAALQTDNTLLDRAISKKVLLATPTTLIALLKAAAYGWRQEAVSKNAEEVSRLGRELYDRIATFADHLGKVGRGLDAATKSYNAAVGSLEGSVLPGARKFEELGAKGQKKLADPSQVETAPREISKRE